MKYALNFIKWLDANFTLKQTDEYDLKPSLNLRTQLHLGSPKWMEMSNEVERFVNLTLSLIHPEQFQSGLKMLQKLRGSKLTKEVAGKWQSVCTAIQIICNRKTPSHRDRKGRPEWFDFLLNYAGGDDARPRFLLHDIGLDLEYSSGTGIGFCGTILEHEVGSWGAGDRVCYAHFMRESVRNRLDVPPAGWVKQEIYLPSASPN